MFEGGAIGPLYNSEPTENLFPTEFCVTVHFGDEKEEEVFWCENPDKLENPPK